MIDLVPAYKNLWGISIVYCVHNCMKSGDGKLCRLCLFGTDEYLT